jgi:O-antigen ligase
MTSASPVATLTSSRLHAQPINSPVDSILLYGIFSLLIFGPLAFGAVEPWSIFVLRGGAAFLFVVWAVHQTMKEEIRIHWNPLFVPAICFNLLVCAQLAGGYTAYRAATISGLLLYGSYGLLAFLLVQCLRRRRQLETVAFGLSIFGSAVALFAVCQDLSSNGKLYWLRVPSNGGWIYGPYVNHNHYAGLMEMLAPIPLVVCLSRARRARKLLAAVAAALMVSTVFLCGSRGGMLAVSGQMFLAGVVLVRRMRTRKPILAFGSFLLLTICLLAWLGDAEVLHRIMSLHDEAHSELSGGVRLAIDHDTMGMFAKKPTLGWGLGSFSVVYPEFRSFYTNSLVDHAHNDYLELLAETGLAGFAILIWFLVVVFRSSIKKLKEGANDVNALAALAAILGITGILIHSLMDFNLQIPANAAFFYSLCTMAALQHQFATRRHGSARGHKTIAPRLNVIPDSELQ